MTTPTPTGSRRMRLGMLGAAVALTLTATAVVAQSPSASPVPTNPGTAPVPTPAATEEAAPRERSRGVRPDRPGRPFLRQWVREFGPRGRGVPFQQGPFGRGGLPGPLQGQPRGAAVVGPITVESVDGTTLNLVTADGWRRSVDTTGVTITRDGEEITAADVSAGDTVRLRQTQADDGTWSVTAIAVVLPVVTGEVGEIGTDSFTVVQGDGTTVTIHVSEATDWHVPGSSAPGIGDLEVGDRVAARGTRQDDGSIAATDVATRGAFAFDFERGPVYPDPDTVPEPDATVEPTASPALTG